MMNLKNGKIKRFISCATLGAIMLAGLGLVHSAKALDKATYVRELHSLGRTAHRINDFQSYIDRLISIQRRIEESEANSPGLPQFFPGCLPFPGSDSPDSKDEIISKIHRDGLRPGTELGIYQLPDDSDTLLVNHNRLTAVLMYNKATVSNFFRRIGYGEASRPLDEHFELLGQLSRNEKRSWSVRRKNVTQTTDLPAQPAVVWGVEMAAPPAEWAALMAEVRATPVPAPVVPAFVPAPAPVRALTPERFTAQPRWQEYFPEALEDQACAWADRGFLPDVVPEFYDDDEGQAFSYRRFLPDVVPEFYDDDESQAFLF